MERYIGIDAHRDTWESLVRPGQKILVCDIGGGTSDFTLIRVRAQGGQSHFLADADDASSLAPGHGQKIGTVPVSSPR